MVKGYERVRGFRSNFSNTKRGSRTVHNSSLTLGEILILGLGKKHSEHIGLSIASGFPLEVGRKYLSSYNKVRCHYPEHSSIGHRQLNVKSSIVPKAVLLQPLFCAPVLSSR